MADVDSFVTARPEYDGRYLGSVLAQGAALHFVNGITGVKDLDVWSFFAAIPGTGRSGWVKFPADRRHVTADFGPSSLGRQRYNMADATTPTMARRYAIWSQYEGRRVDLLVRPSPVALGTPLARSVEAWLATGTTSASMLARKPIVGLQPARQRGRILYQPEVL